MSQAPAPTTGLEPITRRGLAAAVLSHLPEVRPVQVQGGTDNQGPNVFIATGEPRALISVTVTPEATGFPIGQVRSGPAFSDDNSDGSTLMGSATRADGTIVMFFAEFYGEPLLTVAEAQGLIDDPLISTMTTPEVNAAGADLANYTEGTSH